MKKYYKKVSLKSKFLNFAFKFTNAKKNYLTEENTKKFIGKYQKEKKKYDLFDKYDFVEEDFPGRKVYSFNGTINDNKGKILIYIHGGSFVEEAISYQLEFAMLIALSTNSTLVVPRYKLIPDGTYKDLYSLMDDVYEKVLFNTDDIEFLGDSSGGGFILAYSMYLRDKNFVLPNNLLMLTPWVDLTMKNKELLKSIKYDNMSGIEGNRYCGKLWANKLDTEDPLVSPIYGYFEGLPKMTIATGSFDILRPDCMRLASILDDEGIEYNYIEYKNQGHDFGCYPTKEGNMLIEDFSKIINNK